MKLLRNKKMLNSMIYHKIKDDFKWWLHRKKFEWKHAPFRYFYLYWFEGWANIIDGICIVLTMGLWNPWFSIHFAEARLKLGFAIKKKMEQDPNTKMNKARVKLADAKLDNFLEDKSNG